MNALTAALLAGTAIQATSAQAVIQIAANSAPLVSYLIEQGLVEESEPSFKIASRRITNPRTQVNGGAFDETTTTITVDDSSGFLPNQQLKFEGTDEIGIISAVPSPTTISVVRGVGATNAQAASVADNAYVRSIGSAAGEGAEPGDANMSSAAQADQHCQTQHTQIKLTGRADRTSSIFSQTELLSQREVKLLEHMRDLDSAIKFSALATTTVNSETVYSTNGLYNAIQGLTAVGGNLSASLLEQTIWKDAYSKGNPRKIVLAGPDALASLNGVYSGQSVWRPQDSTIGLQVRNLLHGFGEAVVIQDNNLQGSNSGDMLILDPGFLMLKHSRIDARGHGGLPHVLENVKKDGSDAVIDQVVSECGIDYMNEEVHHIVTGISGAA